MQVPSILLKAKDEFQEIGSKCRKKYYLFTMLNKLLILFSILAGLCISLSDEMNLSVAQTKILGAVVISISALSQSFNLSKNANHADIMRKKARYLFFEIESKIEEFNSYFRGSSDVENSEIPEEFSTRAIISFLTEKYREIDEISLSYLTNDSYERLMRQ